MKFLFIFLDGVGLGVDDPQVNPLAKAHMPALQQLLGGGKLLRESAPCECARATLLPLDSRLGVPGIPQSATGQATLLTGKNVPAEIGYHYGPKPNPDVALALRNGNLFHRLVASGHCAAFLNAYPPRYFEAINSGMRMYSAIPMAVHSAGIALRTSQDLYAGNALAADFTARGWREFLGFADTPVISSFQAGERLSHLADRCEFSFFEYWLSDYAGHHQDMDEAVRLMEEFDGVLEGLAASWRDEAGLVLITSDHGNLEDLSTRRHTQNPVPALLIGDRELRKTFSQGLSNLADVAPAIIKLFSI